METTVNLFNVNVSSELKSSGKCLILSGCRVDLSDESAFSEIDMQSFYLLDRNDYGFGRMFLELAFDGDVFPYARFYMKCMTLRVNGFPFFKIDQGPSFARLVEKNYTKINKDGKMVLGVEYYFKSAEERAKLLNCDSFCFEGFLALKHKFNVYSFVCKVCKADEGWSLQEGNTFKTTKYESIDGFWH